MKKYLPHIIVCTFWIAAIAAIITMNHQEKKAEPTSTNWASSTSTATMEKEELTFSFSGPEQAWYVHLNDSSIEEAVIMVYCDNGYFVTGLYQKSKSQILEIPELPESCTRDFQAEFTKGEDKWTKEYAFEEYSKTVKM